MTRFRRLSETVLELHGARATPSVAALWERQPREAAAVLAMEQFGRDTVRDLPAFVNLAALALAKRARPVLHVPRPGVVHLGADTDVLALPRRRPACSSARSS